MTTAQINSPLQPLALELSLIGIGTGNPDHMTRQAEAAIRAQDLILIPNKGAGKDDLAGLRHAICAEILAAGDPTAPGPRIVEFDLPVRDPSTPDYRRRVDDWHDAIAKIWDRTIAQHLPAEQTQVVRVGFLVWGDPSLYDSTMRIAERLKARRALTLRVYPGITSIQALTAAHAIPLNDIAAPVLITTGRNLRQDGWPEGCDRLVIMLDGECSFSTLPDPAGIEIFWTAYAGMANEISIAGPLDQVSEQIMQTRAAARAQHGWIMDIYLLRRA